MQFSAEARIYLSGTHLETARFMEQEAARHEANQVDSASREVIFCALNAVLSSAAFLEAQVNELLLDAAEGINTHGTKNLSENDRALLKCLWPLLERLSILDKFQEILKFLRGKQIDKSTAVWGDALALIRLRNYLVHYKPESSVILSTIDEQQVENLSIEKQLSGKFQPNPWFDNSTTAFVASHLSAGCAKWATDTSLAFADEFYRIVGVTPPYDGLRNTKLPSTSLGSEPAAAREPGVKRIFVPLIVAIVILAGLLLWRW